jgi:hypothetical protein
MYTRIHINAMSPPTTTPTPTPTPDPYAAKVVTPNVPKGLPGAPIPAPVSIIPNFASQNAASAAAHNQLVQANIGGKVGGSKSKSKSKTKTKSRSKSRSKSKRTKRSGSKSKSRSKSKRRTKSKRGGASIPTPTPTPTPTTTTVTVPQFPGSTSANAASVGGNHLAMKQAAQAALDNTNAPPTDHRLP